MSWNTIHNHDKRFLLSSSTWFCILGNYIEEDPRHETNVLESNILEGVMYFFQSKYLPNWPKIIVLGLHICNQLWIVPFIISGCVTTQCTSLSVVVTKCSHNTIHVGLSQSTSKMLIRSVVILHLLTSSAFVSYRDKEDITPKNTPLTFGNIKFAGRFFLGGTFFRTHSCFYLTRPVMYNTKRCMRDHLNHLVRLECFIESFGSQFSYRHNDVLLHIVRYSHEYLYNLSRVDNLATMHGYYTQPKTLIRVNEQWNNTVRFLSSQI